MCFHLFNKQIRFTLAYPAILRMTSRDEKQNMFSNPEEAELFLEHLENPDEKHPVRSLLKTPAQKTKISQKTLYTTSPHRGRRIYHTYRGERNQR